MCDSKSPVEITPGATASGTGRSARDRPHCGPETRQFASRRRTLSLSQRRVLARSCVSSLWSRGDLIAVEMRKCAKRSCFSSSSSRRANASRILASGAGRSRHRSPRSPCPRLALVFAFVRRSAASDCDTWSLSLNVPPAPRRTYRFPPLFVSISSRLLFARFFLAIREGYRTSMGTCSKGASCAARLDSTCSRMPSMWRWSSPELPSTMLMRASGGRTRRRIPDEERSPGTRRRHVVRV